MKLNNNDDSHNSGLNLLIYNMLLDIESHPAWVCGLKQSKKKKYTPHKNVTPCVGVWIETMLQKIFGYTDLSHPAWVCGLKHGITAERANAEGVVTPCVGVWIETTLYLYPDAPLSHTLRGCVD